MPRRSLARALAVTLAVTLAAVSSAGERADSVAVEAGGHGYAQ